MAKAKPSLGCGYAVAGALLAGGGALIALAANDGAKIIGTILVVVAVIYGSSVKRIVRKAEAEERYRAGLANEPWKWRKEWLGPALESEDHKGDVGIWALTVFLNAISAPVAYAVFFAKKRPDSPVAYIGLIFPMLGALMLVGAIYRTIQRVKFWRPRFFAAELPGAIGGYLGGAIEVPARVVPLKDAVVSLKSVRRVTTGAGKSRRVTETVLWQHEEHIGTEKWQTTPGQTAIPVLFYIPVGQTPSDVDRSNNEVIWRLAAKVETAGVDFAATFCVPVFSTGVLAEPPAGRGV